MRDVNACPACGGTERDLVLEYNGLVLLEYMRESPLCRYNYSLCHRCGLVYATRRPEGDEVAWLYSRFDEFLGRTEDEQTAGRVTEITPEEREQLNRRLARGWLVSEEGQPASDEWMPDVFDERVTNSFHANLIGSLIPIEGARILELRSTTGYILDVLKRRYGAGDVVAMPMSERHAAIIDAFNPMPMAPLDFERLDVPVEGQFDVILARHMATHAIEPMRLWRALRDKLKPGGYAYLYMENDDRVMQRRKNLLGEMKCFHFQNFDLQTLARVLRYQGLNTVFIRHPRRGRSEMLCLARREDGLKGAPISAAELRDRLALYRRWRDHSILSLDTDLQALFATELDDITQRALASGDAIRKKAGELIVKKPLRLMHADGYAQLNASGSH